MRALAAVVFAGTLAMLLVAALLTPDPAGHGTHEQLGLPPCGMMIMFGLPCPTCGMTTAFAHAVRGHMIRSFVTQPFGMLLAVCAGLVCAGAGYVLATGRSWAVNWFRLRPAVVALVVVLLALLAWGYKVAMVLREAG